MRKSINSSLLISLVSTCLVVFSCNKTREYSILEEQLITQLGDPESYKLIDQDTFGIRMFSDTSFSKREFIRLKYYYKNEYNSQVIGIHYFIIQDDLRIVNHSSKLKELKDLPLLVYKDYLVNIGFDNNSDLKDLLYVSQDEINRMDIQSGN